jgi:hypothetical protein
MFKYDFTPVNYILRNNYRHGLLNNIHVHNVDDNKFQDGTRLNSFLMDVPIFVYCTKIGELDWVQEIEGFFLSRKKVYIDPTIESIDFTLPDEVEIKEEQPHNYVAGDYIVDPRTLYVYRVHGWDRNNGSSEFYWDFFNDGMGATPFHYTTPLCCSNL